MVTTIKVVNPSSNDYTLIVGGAPIHIPAHRWSDNPAQVHIREDLLPALLNSIKKRPVLRVLPVEVPGVPEELDPEPETLPDRSEFMSACKASKAEDGSWNLTLPNGEKMTVEADHHLRAKEIAYEMLYAAPADKE
jgi:hypothetical protein